MFTLLQQCGSPEAIKAAYKADPDVMGTLIRAEIADHLEVTWRDHSARTYVQLLRQIIGAPGDANAEHEKAMRDALAKIDVNKAPADRAAAADPGGVRD
jgi:hypothetical protein